MHMWLRWTLLINKFQLGFEDYVKDSSVFIVKAIQGDNLLFAREQEKV